MLTITIISSVLALIFLLLFLASRRITSNLSKRELILATFLIVDKDATDPTSDAGDRTVHVYCLGIPGTDGVVDEAGTVGVELVEDVGGIAVGAEKVASHVVVDSVNSGVEGEEMSDGF